MLHMKWYEMNNQFYNVLHMFHMKLRISMDVFDSIWSPTNCLFPWYVFQDVIRISSITTCKHPMSSNHFQTNKPAAPASQGCLATWLPSLSGVARTHELFIFSHTMIHHEGFPFFPFLFSLNLLIWISRYLESYWRQWLNSLKLR